MIVDLRGANRRSAGDRLTTRKYDEHGAYTTSVVKDFFGSWTDACEAADIRAGRKHGTSCTGPNGERLDSRHEKEVAEFLDSEGWPVEFHPPVPDTDWKADFRVEELDLWIEVDRYQEDGRPNRESFDEKLDHYDQRDMRYAVVSSASELARAASEFGP